MSLLPVLNWLPEVAVVGGLYSTSVQVHNWLLVSDVANVHAQTTLSTEKEENQMARVSIIQHLYNFVLTVNKLPETIHRCINVG